MNRHQIREAYAGLPIYADASDAELDKAVEDALQTFLEVGITEDDQPIDALQMQTFLALMPHVLMQYAEEALSDPDTTPTERILIEVVARQVADLSAKASTGDEQALADLMALASSLAGLGK